MRTSIGDFLMNLRMGQNQRLKDMAEILGVSSAFLSAVENGKKSMPDFWVKKVQTEYGLTDEQVDEMKNAALESQSTIALNMKNATSLNRELAVSFARQFDGMDEETSKMILQVLKKRKKKEDY
ncbi:MAG: helix-turn-helix domain-containing protein [Lachnospiraceae bacterium]|nr:helix-turn-helix domain-containing protein [Lachnospiraceae bacterium]